MLGGVHMCINMEILMRLGYGRIVEDMDRVLAFGVGGFGHDVALTETRDGQRRLFELCTV